MSLPTLTRETKSFLTQLIQCVHYPSGGHISPSYIANKNLTWTTSWTALVPCLWCKWWRVWLCTWRVTWTWWWWVASRIASHTLGLGWVPCELSRVRRGWVLWCHTRISWTRRVWRVTGSPHSWHRHWKWLTWNRIKKQIAYLTVSLHVINTFWATNVYFMYR